MKNIEHSYTAALATFDKAKRIRDNIQAIREVGDDALLSHEQIVMLALECQQDLLKVIAGLIDVESKGLTHSGATDNE